MTIYISAKVLFHRKGDFVKALVVDDAKFMRMKLIELLKKNGCDIVGEAENGKIAVKKYIELKPDIVTMDMVMPVMDGMAAAEKILQYDPGASIIVVSVNGLPLLKAEAIKKGVKDYLVKPYHVENLEVIVREMGIRKNR